MIGLQERLEDAFRQFGWSRIPEVLHYHAEEASKHNISYLEFLDKLLQEEQCQLQMKIPHYLHSNFPHYRQ